MKLNKDIIRFDAAWQVANGTVAAEALLTGHARSTEGYIWSLH